MSTYISYQNLGFHRYILGNGPIILVERINIDFTGPFKGQNYFTVEDSNSKRPEVELMSTTTSTAPINVLKFIFSHLGLPKTLVSDIGPQFVANKSNAFLRQNRVIHVSSSYLKIEMFSVPSTNSTISKEWLAVPSCNSFDQVPFLTYLNRPFNTRQTSSRTETRFLTC